MTREVMDAMTRAADDPATPHVAAFDAKEPVMSNLIQPSVFLRRVLVVDAIGSAATAALMVLDAGLLQRWLGLPASLLMATGLALLPYVAYLLWLATRQSVPRAAVWVPIVLNLVWAADCVLAMTVGGASPMPLGEAFIAGQVLVSLLFAELEFIGLRKACVIVVA